MNFCKKRGGQVTAELMLILPVFMLMIFFVLEYGNIAYHEGAFQEDQEDSRFR